MVLIIGALGFQGSGKDTVGKILEERHGFNKLSFAEPLKDAVSMVFGWDRGLLEGATKESRLWREEPDVWWEEKLNWHSHPGHKQSSRFTPRFALQYWGTEVLRDNFHLNIWMLSLQRRIMALGYDKVIITDCRFTNEATFIQELGGKIVRVKNGPEPEWYETALMQNDGLLLDSTMETDYPHVHASEYKWIGLPFDHVIENNGTLGDLENKVSDWISGL